jgi:cell filamentation protein
VVDWNLVDKEAYLSAMQRSVIKDVEIKALLKQALTHQMIKQRHNLLDMFIG